MAQMTRISAVGMMNAVDPAHHTQGAYENMRSSVFLVMQQLFRPICEFICLSVKILAQKKQPHPKQTKLKLTKSNQTFLQIYF